MVKHQQSVHHEEAGRNAIRKLLYPWSKPTIILGDVLFRVQRSSCGWRQLGLISSYWDGIWYELPFQLVYQPWPFIPPWILPRLWERTPPTIYLNMLLLLNWTRTKRIPKIVNPCSSDGWLRLDLWAGRWRFHSSHPPGSALLLAQRCGPRFYEPSLPFQPKLVKVARQDLRGVPKVETRRCYIH